MVVARVVVWYIVFGLLLLANIMSQTKLNLTTRKYLKDRRSYQDLMKAQRAADIAFIVGTVLFFIWMAFVWLLFCLAAPPMPDYVKVVIVITSFTMMAIDLLIPIHFEERCELRYWFTR